MPDRANEKRIIISLSLHPRLHALVSLLATGADMTFANMARHLLLEAAETRVEKLKQQP